MSICSLLNKFLIYQCDLSVAYVYSVSNKQSLKSIFFCTKLFVSSVFFPLYIRNALFFFYETLYNRVWFIAAFISAPGKSSSVKKPHHRQLQIYVKHTTVYMWVDTRPSKFDKQNYNSWKQTSFLYRSRREGVCLSSTCVCHYQWAIIYDGLLCERPQWCSQSNIHVDRMHTRLVVYCVLIRIYSLTKAIS